MTKLQLLNSLLIKQLEVTVQGVMRMVNDTVAEYIEETARAKCESARLRKKLREITLVAATEASSNALSVFNVEEEPGESFQSLVQNRGMAGDAEPEKSQEQNPEPGQNIEVKNVFPDHQKLGQELEIKMETHRLVIQPKAEPVVESEGVDSYHVSSIDIMPGAAFNPAPPMHQVLMAGMDVDCTFPAVEVETGISDMQPSTHNARGGKLGRGSSRDMIYTCNVIVNSS
ncbi:hypothetical protein DPEC_G00355130 [Dallia pectoralis]|uniref:Uncharacterized protein n=1 Tax=Dallia pectoralis TaxID=75939 RepID=A0ACC2EZD4_DALPE|nr:hypothetical protein DPEC_G00355130 [Dallia pectoralis]